MNLQDALELFLADHEFIGSSPNTIRWYEFMLSPFVERGGEIDAVTAADVKDFLKAQQARKVANESVRGFARALKAFFNWLVAEEYLEKSPRIKAPKKKRQLPKSATLADVQALVATCKHEPIDHRDKAIIALMIGMGLRVGGVLGLHLCDIDMARGTVVVEEKDGLRAVPIKPEVKPVLFAWLKARPTDHGTDRVFLSLNGVKGPLGYTGVRLMLRRRAELAGVTGRVNPHSLRHAFAKEYVQNGGDTLTLREILGHKDSSITGEFYGVWEVEGLKKPLEKFSPTVDFGV